MAVNKDHQRTIISKMGSDRWTFFRDFDMYDVTPTISIADLIRNCTNTQTEWMLYAWIQCVDQIHQKGTKQNGDFIHVGIQLVMVSIVQNGLVCNISRAMHHID